MLAESFQYGLNCLQAAQRTGGADPHQLDAVPEAAVFSERIAVRIYAGRDDSDPVFRFPPARLVAQIRIAGHYEVGGLHGRDKALQTAWTMASFRRVGVAEENSVVKV